MILNAKIPVPALYGVPQPDPVIDNRNIIIVLGAILIGAIVGVGILVTRKIKKKKNAKTVKGQKGSSQTAEPLEEFYGCPRPDEIDDTTKK